MDMLEAKMGGRICSSKDSARYFAAGHQMEDFVVCTEDLKE